MIRVVVGSATTPRSRTSQVPEELRWEEMSVEEVATLASTASLLGEPHVFTLSGVFSGEKADEFLALVPGLVASPHLFVFAEEKLLKRPTDILTKAGAQIEVNAPVKKKEPFNVFALGGVFATRDRKKFWLSLTAAAHAGVVPEAVAGMLHWKVRDMLAKSERGRFTPAELKKISRNLVSLYHDSHRGAGDLELLLERFALRL